MSRKLTKTFYKDPMTTVSLYCQSDKQQTSEMVMWKKKPHDEMLFFMETRHTSDKYYSLDRSYNDWNLVITTILERHEGVYICCQIVRGTEITIREYTLFVNGPPEIPPNTPWTTNLAVVEGDIVDMRCDIKGSPKPSINWFTQEGEQINPIHIKGSLLQVRNITRLCVTKFVCLAENRFSQSPINMTFNIEVEFPSQMFVYDAKSHGTDESSSTIYRKRGIEIKLRCDVMASPDVKIYWKVKKRKGRPRLRELATYIPGEGVSDSSKKKEDNFYRFEYHLLPQKKVTIFDMIFITDQAFTFSEYVCETDKNTFPGTRKSLTVAMLP
ncbi:hemicentin-2-like isoform X2 [Ostrea edulis]|uniref:hemicentin-2-like isoform X2 n=1 Tax=Ostrea edulis TaxID=37623 RepID=UPI0024AFC45A|nr:hemicentin-2-like isoform X2 [Ostrea edulis]